MLPLEILMQPCNNNLQANLKSEGTQLLRCLLMALQSIMKVGDRAKTSLIGSKKKFQRHRKRLTARKS